MHHDEDRIIKLTGFDGKGHVLILYVFYLS